MINIKGIKKETLWAVFAPDGYLQYRTISDTRKEARERVIGYWEQPQLLKTHVMRARSAEPFYCGKYSAEGEKRCAAQCHVCRTIETEKPQ